MSNVSGIGSPSTYGADMGLPSGISPDSLLAYCQAQLGSLDSTMTSDMQIQEQQLSEHNAVTQAANSLTELFGSNGPQSGPQFEQCMAAIDQAAQSLPAGDPVATQLEQFKQQMMTQYDYQPGHTEWLPIGLNGDQGVIKPVPSSITTPSDGQWAATTAQLSNIASGINSNSQIGMLQLQDLVSQRQQAIEVASGMMTTEDNTLEDEAKAIGQ
jgi:hypothetical protein